MFNLFNVFFGILIPFCIDSFMVSAKYRKDYVGSCSFEPRKMSEQIGKWNIIQCAEVEVSQLKILDDKSECIYSWIFLTHFEGNKMYLLILVKKHLKLELNVVRNFLRNAVYKWRFIFVMDTLHYARYTIRYLYFIFLL